MKRLSFYLIITGFSFAIGVSAFVVFSFISKPEIRLNTVLPKEHTEQIALTNNREEPLVVMGVFEFTQKTSETFRNIQWMSINNAIPIGYGCATSDGSPCNSNPTNLPKWKMQQPNGIIITDNKVFSWKSDKLSVDEVSFTTNEKEDISYKFSGRFLKSGNYEDIKPSGVVLQGQLKKLVNNQLIAEEYVEMRWRSWDDVNQETMKLKRKFK